VVFEANANAHPVGVTGAPPREAGRGEVGAHAAAPPSRIDVSMRAVMFPSGAGVVVHWSSAAHGAHRLPRDGGVRPGHGKRLSPGVIDGDHSLEMAAG
jgi:hypothetical protein